MAFGKLFNLCVYRDMFALSVIGGPNTAFKIHSSSILQTLQIPLEELGFGVSGNGQVHSKVPDPKLLFLLKFL